MMQSCNPDTTYGVDSGGNPDVIPTLTYEDYLNFHRRYYHPSNSYIFLCGNMDVEERLTFLDTEYLSHFDAISPIPPFIRSRISALSGKYAANIRSARTRIPQASHISALPPPAPPISTP